jgi:hypothetical protein
MVNTEFPRNRGGYSGMDFLFAAIHNAGQIGGIPTCLYLWLSEQNLSGAYPGASMIARAFQIHVNSVANAEKVLERAGLLRLSGPRQKKIYTLVVPVTQTDAQKAFWERASNETCRDRALEAAVESALNEPPPEIEIEPRNQVVVVLDPPPSQPTQYQPQETREAAPVPALQPQEAIPRVKPDPVPEAVVEAPKVVVAAKAKKTKEVMSPEMAEWFLSSSERMNAYLRFGQPAYGKKPEELIGLASEGTDWLSHGPADPVYPFHKAWTHNKFMGYYWSGVCKWRAANGYPLNLPRWGRLSGDISNLLKTTTAYDAFTNIWITINHFALIQFLIGKIAEGMVLDETTLSHSLVRQQVLNIRKHGQQWMDEQYALIDGAAGTVEDDDEE